MSRESEQLLKAIQAQVDKRTGIDSRKPRTTTAHRADEEDFLRELLRGHVNYGPRVHGA